MGADRVERHITAESAQAWLDGELTPSERATVEAHLRACAACQEAMGEWRALGACLAAYAPPPEQPGAAEALWRRLAPRLPAQRDPATYVPPLALGLAHMALQGIAAALAVLVLLGGWQALANDLLANTLVNTWWGLALRAAGSLLGQVAPADSATVLVPAGLALVGWWLLAVLAGLYAAWMIFWLRQPGPVTRGTLEV